MSRMMTLLGIQYFPAGGGGTTTTTSTTSTSTSTSTSTTSTSTSTSTTSTTSTSSTSTTSTSSTTTPTPGYLYAFGNNVLGQFGNETIIYNSVPTQVGVNPEWWKLAIGGYNSFAIKTDFTLWGTGDNGIGQLCDGTTSNKSSWTQIGTGQWKNVGVAFGGSQAWAIDWTDNLYVWGVNTSGQLGLGDVVSRSSPTQLAGSYRMASFTALAGIFLKTDGTIWGSGVNTQNGIGGANISSPVQIGVGTNWTKISSGQSYTMGLTILQTLWGWGINTLGQLGLNDTANRTTPTSIGSFYTDVSAGLTNVIARKSFGSIWTWGSGSFGGLGQNDTVDRSNPTQLGTDTDWTQIYGGQNTCAAMKTNNMYLWGRGSDGQIGVNGTYDVSSPTQTVYSDNGWLTALGGNWFHSLALRSDTAPIPTSTTTTTTTSTTTTSTTTSTTSTTTSTTTTPTYFMYGWGLGTNGQVGDNTAVSKSTPVQNVMNTQTFIKIGGSFGIDNQGRLWGWGNDAAGQLGQNLLASRSSPVQTVTGGTNWSNVKASLTHTMATKTDGTLWLWGQGGNGQLGNNAAINRSSPVQTVSGGTDWTTKFAIGNATSAAIKSDGTLWTWGFNQSGALGDNSVTQKSSPVLVAGGYTWDEVADGSQAMCGITTDGRLYCWGANNSGQLGQNNITNRSTPIQVGTETNWSKIAMGGNNSAGNEWVIGLKTDGTLWGWGGNTNGQLGIGAATSRSSPTQIGTDTNWSKIAASGLGGGALGSSYATKTNGTLWAWGGNSSGQLGLNDTIHRSSPVQVGVATDWFEPAAMIYLANAFGLKSS